MGMKALLAGILIVITPAAVSAAGWYPVNEAGSAEAEGKERTALTLVHRTDSGEAWKKGPGWQVQVEVPTGTRAYRLRFEARVSGGTVARYDHSIKWSAAASAEARGFFHCGPVLHGDWESYATGFALPTPAPADLYLTVAYGWGTADVEIRNIELDVLAQAPEAGEWRRDGHWYDGQDADAPWREKARQMIDKHRKADLRVQVIDKAGQPIEGARVVLEQQSHAYKFGTAVATQLFSRMRGGEPDPSQEPVKAGIDARRYFDEIVANFNYFVVENGLKAQAWAGDWAGFSRDDTMAAIDWLTQQGLEGKGHVLVWPGWRNAPAYMKEQADDPAALDRLVKAHIADMGTALNGKLAAFDVLNEPYNNNDFMKVLGNAVMAEWFREADQVLPEAQLCLNDFLLIANGGRWTAKLDFYDALIEGLLEDSAPLDVVGFQNHYRHSFLTGPERIWELCDRFGRFGVPLECSEFDVLLEDEQLQAAFTRDFLTAWFAHPSTRAFLLWGFWESEHWLPQAALLTSDWRAKPNYHAYRDLVFNQWWSAWEESLTDKEGTASERVFHGTYRVTVTDKGISKTLDNVVLGRDGLDLVIRL